MLTAKRSLALYADSGKPMPHVEELHDLYRLGVKFRQGQVMMIAGRSGTQKSGFALWLTAQWGLSTLYFSADMSAFTASSRLACMVTGDSTDQVEASKGEERKRYLDAIAHLPFVFSFGSPITQSAIDAELDAYIELWDSFPAVIVFDNLMDFEGADADYTAQMEVMSFVTELARNTGSTVLILHHASDKTWEAKSDPWSPPSRDQIKGGLSEKPELSLSVALDPHTLAYHVACVKQRMGPQDPTAGRYATLRCHPDVTRFSRYVIPKLK